MPLSINSYLAQIVAGQGRKPGPIHDALQAIATWATAGLRDADIAADAAIAISKTALGTYTEGTAFTPTLYKNDSTTVWTTSALNYSRYSKLGKWVIWHLTITPNSGANTGVLGYITLPVAAKSDPTYSRLAGACTMICTGNAAGWPVRAIINPTGDRIVFSWVSVYPTQNSWADCVNPTLEGLFIYEAAS